MDEKKKLITLLALVALMVCIGGFQFTKKKTVAPPPPDLIPKSPGSAASAAPAAAPSPSTPAAPATDAAAPAKAVKDNPIKNPQVTNPLPFRNPFEVPADQLPPGPAPLPQVHSHPHPFPHISGRLPSVPPMGVSGELGEIKPLPSGGGIGTGSDQPGPLPERRFDYKIVGAIKGDRSAIVLQDAAGNQKLVPEGAAIDGESRVKSVENGAAWIEYRGKKLRVIVGGISVDKK